MAVRRLPLVGILLAALGVVALAAAAIPLRPAAAPVREVILRARGTEFVGEGPNPVIEAKPGERLRIVVRNVDPGVVHAIAVPGLLPDVQDIEDGQEAAVEVVVPAGGPGEYEYVCTHHYPLMRGRIVVR